MLGVKNKVNLRDYLDEESPRYQHLSPGKRRLLVTNIKVTIGYALFFGGVVLVAFVAKAVYENRLMFKFTVE
jgi:hypothetical protein